MGTRVSIDELKGPRVFIEERKSPRVSIDELRATESEGIKSLLNHS